MIKRKPRKLTQKELAAKIARFNEKHPIGCNVVVRKDDGTEVKTVTRSEAMVLSGHSAVIWLKGIIGCYALDSVTPF